MGFKSIECVGIGTKDVYIAELTDGSWCGVCACNALYAMVKIPLTTEQAQEILSGHRRDINEVLPDTDRALREVFITGTTPAEWDLMLTGHVKPEEEYAELAYVFQSVTGWMVDERLASVRHHNEQLTED